MATILVIDDSADTCRLLVQLFAHMGHSGVCVPTGHAALEQLKVSLPDLVLLDVMMPDMEGTEVLRMLRADARTASLPVVIYSAVSDPAFRQHALKLGANDYWVKSRVDFYEMRQRVEKLVTAQNSN